MAILNAKHASLKSKSKTWLAGGQDNAFYWSDMHMTVGCFGMLTPKCNDPNSVCLMQISHYNHHLCIIDGDDSRGILDTFLTEFSTV